MQKWRGTKEPLDEGEKESEKADLKLNIQKIKIMASSPMLLLSHFSCVRLCATP